MRGRVSKKRKVDGFILDSSLEEQRYYELKALERAGEINGLEVHPKWEIKIGDFKICDYTADFKYGFFKFDTVVEDVKAFRYGKDGKLKFSSIKRDFILVKKLMLALFGIDIQVWPERPKRVKNKKEEKK